MTEHQEIPVVPFEVRPRFEMWTRRSCAEISAQIKNHLAKTDSICAGKVKTTYASLQPVDSIRHYWSPHLSITYEETEEGTHVRGLYGPAPTVWTMFIFFYAVLAFLILVVSVIGMANMQIGDSGAILYSLPVLILTFFSLYIVSYTGQRKGHDQVEAIHRLVETCVDPYRQD